MLNWEVMTGDQKLQATIDDTKNVFDSWFAKYWGNGRVTREQMLSPRSPVLHVYHKMCLPFDEVKKLHPSEAKERCSDCGEEVEKWISATFSFCDEYDCGMSLCQKCAGKLRDKIDELLKEE